MYIYTMFCVVLFLNLIPQIDLRYRQFGKFATLYTEAKKIRVWLLCSFHPCEQDFQHAANIHRDISFVIQF